MKKLILAVLILVSAKSFSQTATESPAPEKQGFIKGIVSRLEFGIKAGANVSNFEKFNIPTDPLIGYHAGLTVAYKFNDHFMVQEDFLYSLQGAKLKSGVLGTQDIKLSYLQVPIVLKYRTTSGFYIEGGAQTGILLKEEVAGYNSDQKFAKKIEASAIGGIGFQTKMGLGIGARYAYGFTKVSDTPSAALGDFKNSTIQASLIYRF
jgi:hypothetical protein